jgi:Putative beta-barrel porin-2, OmpL-like. bbp2
MNAALLALALVVGQTPTDPVPSLPARANEVRGNPPAKLNVPSIPTLPSGTGDAPSKSNSEDQAKTASSEASKDKGDPAPKIGFFPAVWKANKDEFCPPKDAPPAPDEPEKPRRANPAPFAAPPFPGAEWQGYPNIGVPPADYGSYSIMQGLYNTPWGDQIKDSRIYLYGWMTASGNFSSSKNSNIPDSYAIVPNRLEMDQAVIRLEREPDTVQTDHLDWGFRLTNFYGIDYRYTTAGGDFSDQLLKNNRLYGDDPLEYYAELYIPGVADGLNLRVGRYISPPDIEAQLAPDNYLASHSILFTYDNYTQTGILATLKLNNQWMVQAGINAGGDMAPWYKGAMPTGFLGLRWISADNNDSIYTCYNDINDAKYRQFSDNGVPTGHDNYNYIVSTWSHRCSDKFITSTEVYYMYEYDSPLGGTPSTGTPQSFGGGGGEGPILHGLSTAFGILNYTAYGLTKKDYVTIRNEFWDDNRGMRSGFATPYTSNTIGIAHSFNSYFQVRPEIGYYRSYNEAAFDNGTRHNQVMFECDVTYRF